MAIICRPTEEEILAGYGAPGTAERSEGPTEVTPASPDLEQSSVDDGSCGRSSNAQVPVDMRSHLISEADQRAN